MYVKMHRMGEYSICRPDIHRLAAVVKVFVVLCMFSPIFAQAFDEGWESAAKGTYSPDDFFLPADEGTWFIGDSVSEFPECGPTPQMAEIIESGGSRALRLTSSDSNSSCADNVWIDLTDASRVGPLTVNQGFAIPINTGTRIAFKQSGALIDAERHGWGRNCIGPPCFDNISMQLVDNRGNILTYVLQRAADAEANVPNSLFGGRYREIFLDPNARVYNRDLFDDLNTIPGFVSSNAQILSISLKVDEHGWAIFDDIAIGADIAVPSPTPEPTPEQPAEPTIMANGVVNTAAISISEKLSVTIALTANDHVDQNADFWVVANTPFGWYYYRYQTTTWINVGNSISDILPTYQGGVFNLPSFEVLSIVGLPVGAYTFYFGIDMNSNGQLDMDSLLFDGIVVNVSE